MFKFAFLIIFGIIALGVLPKLLYWLVPKIANKIMGKSQQDTVDK